MTITASPGGVATSLSEALFGAHGTGSASMATADVIGAMLDSGTGISDLIFSPGRAPQVERHGDLKPVAIPDLPVLRPEDTARVASDLIGGKEQVLRTLQQEGACDLSYSLPERARFRVNIFRQRGSFAIVMRVIASKIPTLADLNLPPALAEMFQAGPDRRDLRGGTRAQVPAPAERACGRAGRGPWHPRAQCRHRPRGGLTASLSHGI